MDEHRHGRLTAVIHHALGDFLREELQVGEGVFPTISFVEITDKGTLARVHVATFPKEAREEVEKKLKTVENKAVAYLRKNLRLKFIPTVRFIGDHGSDNVERIGELLNK